MKAIGNCLKVALLLLAGFATAAAQAELSATVDRDRIAMGDTLRLTIAATDNEPINNVELRPLLRDFEILQRTTSSSTQIINGQRSSSREVHIDLTPKREGALRIPALRVGRETTNYLQIAVAPQATASGDPLVSFEAELSKSSVYVQEQVILTLRVQQAINLDARSINEFQLDNAFVKPLEQKSFQRTIEGRPWLVYELRYAIFPQESGSLVIPEQTFSARERQTRHTLSYPGSSGRQITRRSEPLTLTVLPMPSNYPNAPWLPSPKLEIQESWSTPPEQLRVGESITRQVTISAEGLQGAQLPPTLFPATEGLKYYPDQPQISEAEIASGLIGSRTDSTALVPARAGDWAIPEIRIPWWDTNAGKMRYAVLPARKVAVAASLNPGQAPLPNTSAATPDFSGFDNSPIATQSTAVTQVSWWPWAALGLGAGWLITLLYVWFNRSRVEPIEIDISNQAEPAALKSLLAACITNNALQARTLLVRWAAARYPQQSIYSLEQVQSIFADSELTELTTALNNSLYSTTAQEWNGRALATAVKRLRSAANANPPGDEEALRLYPS